MATKKIFTLFALLLLVPIVYSLSDCSQCGGGCYTTQQVVDQGNLIACEGAQFNDPCGSQDGQPKFCYKSPSCGNGACDTTDSTCPQECQNQQLPPSAAASEGSANPSTHSWFHNESSTDVWNEMLQIKITNNGEEDISLVSITLKASGTGNDATNIDRIEVYADLNRNGQVDNDVKIGAAQPAYNADNGITTIGLNYDIDEGDSKNILIAYIMNTDAPAGATYKFTVTEIKAKGKTSNLQFNVAGIPITSATKNIVLPPEPACSGQIKLELKPSTTSAGKLVSALSSGLQNCANQKVEIQSQACNFLIKVLPQCSCVVPAIGDGCSCNFGAPAQDGDYTYHACIDMNKNAKAESGEDGAADLKVRTCQGNPSLTFEPNPAAINQQVTAKISGLTNCFGESFVVDIKDFIMCKVDVLQDTGGSCMLTAPNKVGKYSFTAVTDINGDGFLQQNEVSTSELNVVEQEDVETALPGEEKVETPGNFIGKQSPDNPTCQECVPETWSDCSCVSGNEGTQTGTCQNNCGYGLVKAQACTCAAESRQAQTLQLPNNQIIIVIAVIAVLVILTQILRKRKHKK